MARRAAADELRRQAGAIFVGDAVAGLGDGELLERFVRRGASGDVEAASAAFGVLVARHGGMVLGVCRRALRDPDDAEDAFQAVFLVLARKAGSVRVDDSLGRWLYGVSRKVAARARSRSERRRAREVSSVGVDAPEPAGRASAEAVAERDDLRGVILDELARLPARYREAIEACDLDGCTHEEAALRLGWPVGTVRSRLSRGRDRLRGRLTRRGVGLPGMGTPAVRGFPGSIPPALATATIRTATRFALRRALDGSVPIAVAALTEGALRAMAISKLTIAISAVLLVAGTAVATIQFSASRAERPGPPPEPSTANPPGLAPAAEGVGAQRTADTMPTRVALGGGPQLGGGPGGGFQAGGFEGPGFGGAGKHIEVMSGPIIAIRSPTRDRLTAHDASTGVSDTYSIPDGVTAVPVVNTTLIALEMQGETIDQIAAFGLGSESWSVQKLATPASGGLGPVVVGPGLAAYHDGRYVYGFSAAAGKWDTLEREEGADGTPVVYSDYILCDDEDRIYVFGLRTGRWVAIEVE